MKRILSLVLTLAMLGTMCVFTSVSVSASDEQWNGQAATSFSGGTGTESDPYQIATAAELKLFANIVNGKNLTGSFTKNTDACGVLTADIVLNTGTFTVDGDGNPFYNGEAVVEENINVWFPIGYWHDTDGDGIKESVCYQGTFDGATHTISGLYFKNAEQFCVGLFGQLDLMATISNLGIVNSYLEGISVGGVCGESIGTISGCYNIGTITGIANVGGVCGFSDGMITNCYNSGMVSGTVTVGGVCGQNSGDVIGCYNTGAIKGDKEVGGVCGATAFTIDSYNIGTVSGTHDVGGVCGINSYTVTNCYYLDTCAAEGTTFDNGKGEVKTEAQMKMPEFVDLLNANGGDFVYYIGYPAQKWQPNPNIYSTAVTYNVAPVYIVTIPGEVTLGGTVTVSAENVVLDEGKRLEIALTGTSSTENVFTVSNGKTTTLTYQVKDNDANIINVGGTVLTVNPADSARGSATLNFSRPEDSTIIYSGDYTGTVTFTVSVAD